MIMPSISSPNNALIRARSMSIGLSAKLLLLQAAMMGPIVWILSARTSSGGNELAGAQTGSLILVAAGLALAALYPLVAQRISTEFIEKAILVFAPIDGRNQKTAESREMRSLVNNLRLMIRENVDLVVASSQFVVVSTIAPLVVGNWYLLIQILFVVSTYYVTSRRIRRGNPVFLNRVKPEGTSEWIRFRSALSSVELLTVSSPIVFAVGIATASGAIDSLDRLLLLFGLLSFSLSSASSFASSFPSYRFLKSAISNPFSESGNGN